MTRESDWRWLERALANLAPGEYATTNTLIARSIRERGYGLTVHSRAAELRAHQRRSLAGEVVVCDYLGAQANGRRVYGYRLVPTAPKAAA